jgi:hypothetical protein
MGQHRIPITTAPRQIGDVPVANAMQLSTKGDNFVIWTQSMMRKAHTDIKTTCSSQVGAVWYVRAGAATERRFPCSNSRNTLETVTKSADSRRGLVQRQNQSISP